MVINSTCNGSCVVVFWYPKVAGHQDSFDVIDSDNLDVYIGVVIQWYLSESMINVAVIFQSV